jgi:AraC-like DNA-binding protein
MTDDPPLALYRLFETDDLDEARAEVARIFCPHELTIARPSERLDAAHHHARLGDVSLNYVRYGATVTIDPGLLQRFFLVQIPLRGKAEIASGGQRLTSQVGLASIVSPTLATRMEWTADCAQLIVQLERGLLERHLISLIGDVQRLPVEFALGLDVTSGEGAAWLTLVEFVRDQLARGSGPELLVSELGYALVSSLLRLQPSNFSELLALRQGGAAPRHVKRAEEFMRAHADQAITLDVLAQITGVTGRTLQEGFRQFRGVSPLQKLREVRLERVHADLLAPMPGDSVTSLALKWGFTHLGRFAGDYHARYGESPSDTLRLGLAKRGP